MQEVLLFLKDNWQLIVAVIIFILSFILQLIKKKPLGNVYAFLFQRCLEAISLAEEHPVKGQEKLELALDYVKENLAYQYPTLNFESYRKLAILMIEEILDTPQKKGGNAYGEKKTHDEK